MWIYGVIIIFIVGYWMFGPGNGGPGKSEPTGIPWRR